MKELNLDLSIDDIKEMKKSKFMNILKRSTEQKAYMELEKMKANHNKVNHLKHYGIKMQTFLLPPNISRRHSNDFQTKVKSYRYNICFALVFSLVKIC